MKSEPRVVFMRCTENGVENDSDGGLVLFQHVQGQLTDDLIDSRLALSFALDAPMYDYPVTRVEKQARCFKLTIEEIPIEALPPKPASTPTQ
jgi:hypothetical protein